MSAQTSLVPDVDPVFGIPSEVKPFRCEFRGRVRIRLRNDAVASVYIRTETETREFALLDAGDHWTVNTTFEFGRNVRFPEKGRLTNGAALPVQHRAEASGGGSDRLRDWHLEQEQEQEQDKEQEEDVR